MDEVVKLVSDRVGISEAQARQAVETVVGFLEKKLPDPIAGQLRGALSGGIGGPGGVGLGDIKKGLGGMLG